MYCDECHIRPATVKIQIVRQGQVVERALCPLCGQKYGPGLTAPLATPAPFALLNGLMGPPPEAPALPGPARCNHCGYPFHQFQQTSMLGCAECYRSFSPQIEVILRRTQGGTVMHGGKNPGRKGGKTEQRQMLDTLRADLDLAVKEQRFEDAARLRDEIRAREKETADDESAR